jgi:hypothetical protein
MLNNAFALNLQKRFLTEGIQRFRMDTALFAGLRAEWFENEWIQDLDGRSMDEIPPLKLTPAGQRAWDNGEVFMFGGQHRKKALELEEMRLNAEISRTKKLILKLQAAETSPENDAELVGAQRELKTTTVRLQMLPWWGLISFSLGE